MQLRRVILWCFILTASIQSGREGRARPHHADDRLWTVEISLSARFPSDSSEFLKIEVEYPTDVSSVVRMVDRSSADIERTYLRQRSAEPSRYVLMVKPEGNSTKRPSHIIIRLITFGFEEQRLNTGILSYERRNGFDFAKKQLDIDLKARDAPRVENAVKLKHAGSESGAFEIAIFNPTDTEVSVTGVNIFAGVFDSSYKCVGWTAIYDIRLRIIGEEVVGDAKEGSSRNFAYPVTGRFSYYCFNSWMRANISLNHRIQPKSRSILRFRIEEMEKTERAIIDGIALWLSDAQIDKIVSRSPDRKLIATQPRTRTASVRGKQKKQKRKDYQLEPSKAETLQRFINEQFEWGFGFVINDTFIIRSFPE